MLRDPSGSCLCALIAWWWGEKRKTDVTAQQTKGKDAGNEMFSCPPESPEVVPHWGLRASKLNPICALGHPGLGMARIQTLSSTLCIILFFPQGTTGLHFFGKKDLPAQLFDVLIAFHAFPSSHGVPLPNYQYGSSTHRPTGS